MTENSDLHGKYVYLDTNATTELEPEVLNKICSAAKHAWGNPSSKYEHGAKAKSLIEESREEIIQMIGGDVSQKNDIIFTSGGTEANHMAIRSAIKSYKQSHKPRDVSRDLPHLITSNLEHDSVKLLLRELEKRGKIELSEVAARIATARVEVDDVISAVRPNTCLVTIMLANNETGVIQPVAEIFHKLKELNKQRRKDCRVLLHTDAAQAIGKIPVDVHDLQTDYLTIVGHKFYGPRIGALYIRLLDEGVTPLFPVFYGGGQERNYRPGTENTPMIAGLGEAAKIVRNRLHDDVTHLTKLRDHLETRLTQTFETVHFNGRCQDSKRLPNTCNVSIMDGNLKGSVILQNCEVLQASIGAACHAQDRPSHILLSIGVPENVAQSALRLSVGRHTTIQDIDIVIDDLRRTIKKLRS